MIEAKVLAKSKHYKLNTIITTFEVSFPRWILAEFNTHRQLSRNSSSSRAIPLLSNIDNILNDTAMPVHWGLNQKGMVADIEIDVKSQEIAKEIWFAARDSAIHYAKQLNDLGIHKQICNRLIENFTYQKVIVTATEWDNFFYLRTHKDAQPEFKQLASLMLDVYNKTDAEILYDNEWHTPFINHKRTNDGKLLYFDNNNNFLCLEDALKISASCCSQISYRKNDESLEKAYSIFDMLHLTDEEYNEPKHSSPVEHQATPYIEKSSMSCLIHNENNDIYSGNLKNWIQYRHTFKNESNNTFLSK